MFVGVGGAIRQAHGRPVNRVIIFVMRSVTVDQPAMSESNGRSTLQMQSLAG